ncbi:hypothetical protein [Bacteriovorax stolpii]|uniref:hypothetical protein n=1 Tax=Bacteriovorax stolpii TaxID=960 RepID=UPI00163B63D3|nr:hypothetical protein [Bacteriovorax stolpii]
MIFFVRSTPLKEAYEEIGTINLSPVFYSNGVSVLPSSADDLKSYVREQVCSAGRDSIIGTVNGLGFIVEIYEKKRRLRSTFRF